MSDDTELPKFPDSVEKRLDRLEESLYELSEKIHKQALAIMALRGGIVSARQQVKALGDSYLKLLDGMTKLLERSKQQ